MILSIFQICMPCSCRKRHSTKLFCKELLILSNYSHQSCVRSACFSNFSCNRYILNYLLCFGGYIRNTCKIFYPTSPSWATRDLTTSFALHCACTAKQKAASGGGFLRSGGSGRNRTAVQARFGYVSTKFSGFIFS